MLSTNIYINLFKFTLHNYYISLIIESIYQYSLFAIPNNHIYSNI